MNQLRWRIIGICLLCFVSTSQANNNVNAPRGWVDQYSGLVREVSNGNATVRIMPWQSLKGLSIDQWLENLQHDDPIDGQFISSEGAKKERVPGAFSVNRKAKFDKTEGYAVLYGCPGQTGHARLMTLDVRNGSFVDVYKGAMFGEKVCKREPKGAGITQAQATPSGKPSQTADNNTKNISSTEISNNDNHLEALNQGLPSSNKAVSAAVVLDSYWSGFPAMLTHKAVMLLTFPDGTELGCTDWSPAGAFPSISIQQNSDCLFAEDKNRKTISGFEAGERITLAFGRVSAVGIGGTEGSASALSGGDIVMSQDGRIALGSWTANKLSAAAAQARATSTKKTKLYGRYYLDGHTISIATEDGEVIHGLIGYSKDRQNKIKALFLNGKHYWDRKK